MGRGLRLFQNLLIRRWQILFWRWSGSLFSATFKETSLKQGIIISSVGMLMLYHCLIALLMIRLLFVLLKRLYKHVIHLNYFSNKSFSLSSYSFWILMSYLQCDKLLFDCRNLILESLEIFLKLLLFKFTIIQRLLEIPLNPSFSANLT
jgi:hypothetical protein